MLCKNVKSRSKCVSTESEYMWMHSLLFFWVLRGFWLISVLHLFIPLHFFSPPHCSSDIGIYIFLVGSSVNYNVQYILSLCPSMHTKHLVNTYSYLSLLEKLRTEYVVGVEKGKGNCYIHSSNVSHSYKYHDIACNWKHS